MNFEGKYNRRTQSYSSRSADDRPIKSMHARGDSQGQDRRFEKKVHPDV
jgi:hypothetical protein